MKNEETESERNRSAWWAEKTAGRLVSTSESFRLIEESIRRFPVTPEEREQRAQDMEGMPEFVL
jgi:hypothetical protein